VLLEAPDGTLSAAWSCDDLARNLRAETLRRFRRARERKFPPSEVRRALIRYAELLRAASRKPLSGAQVRSWLWRSHPELARARGEKKPAGGTRSSASARAASKSKD